MANYTTINKSSEHFNTKLYTGTGSSNAITGVGFQPDWVWLKSRSNSTYHLLYDAVRGATKQIYSNTSSAEGTDTNTLTSFDSDGFSLGADSGSGANINGYTQVAWNWKANGAGSSNTDGSITSTVSVNQTAGFSIVSWTATGANASIGHGLNAQPKWIFLKCRTQGDKWIVYNDTVANSKYLILNENQSPTISSTHFNNTSPTNAVFYTGTSGNVSGTGEDFIAYCFADVPGYTKSGTVNGNGVADGPFIYTGFAPSFVLYKRNGVGDWYFVDNKRPGYNDNDKRLYANTDQAEETYDLINLYSNGFKLTNSTHAYTNDGGSSYLYLAFGQTLVGTNNVPCTAR